jgi:hypothetical protein
MKYASEGPGWALLAIVSVVEVDRFRGQFFFQECIGLGNTWGALFGNIAVP